MLRSEGQISMRKESSQSDVSPIKIQPRMRSTQHKGGALPALGPSGFFFGYNPELITVKREKSDIGTGAGMGH